MSRLSMKDGRIVLDDQSEKPKSTTQKTSANDSRLSMVDGRIVLADRAPVNTAKNQSYLQRTQKAQQEYLAMDDYTPQRRSSNVMEMAINSLRNRLANSTAGNATREWASRMSNTYQTIANETPVERARRQQARVDRAALIDQVSPAEEARNEARRQQWAIDNAQLIDQASSMYEGPTRTEHVRGRNYDTTGADMFSNDWEPGAMQEYDYLRTVRNERYNPLSREDRDDLINRYADAVNGNVDANTYQQILYDVTKNGGIEQLLIEQQADASKDWRYRAALNGNDVSDMTALQRLGAAWGNFGAGVGEQIAGSAVGAAAAAEFTGAQAGQTYWVNQGKKDAEELVRLYKSPDKSEQMQAYIKQREDALRESASMIGGEDYADRVMAYMQRVASGEEEGNVEAVFTNDDIKLNVGDEEYERNYFLKQSNLDTLLDTSEYLTSEGARRLQRTKDVALLNKISPGLTNTVVGAGATAIESAVDAGIAAALHLAGGPLAYIPFATRAFGGSFTEATSAMRQAGQELGIDALNKAAMYGGASAAIEVATEAMWGIGGFMGQVTGGGALDEVATEKLTEALKGFAKTEAGKKALVKIGEYLMGGTTEGVEEWVGYTLNYLFNTAGIYSGEDRGEYDWKEVWDSFSSAALSTFISGGANAIAHPVQQSQIGKQLKAGGITLNDGTKITVDDMVNLANSPGMEGTTLEKTYSSLLDGTPRATDSFSDRELGKLYEAYEETIGRSEEGAKRVQEILGKVENGEELKRSDVNRITNNPDAARYLRSASGTELNLDGNITERKAAVEEALRAFASQNETLRNAMTENLSPNAENANTGDLASQIKNLPVINRQAMPNEIASGYFQNSTQEAVRNAAQRMGIGEEGQKIMSGLYSGNRENAIDYVGEMTKPYNLGRENKDLNLEDIPANGSVSAEEYQAAWRAGRLDYLAETARKEINNDRAGQEVLVREGTERVDGQNPVGSSAAVGAVTGSPQVGQTGLQQRSAGTERVYSGTQVGARITESQLNARDMAAAGYNVVTDNNDAEANAVKNEVALKAKKYGINVRDVVLFRGAMANVNGFAERGFFIYHPDGTVTIAAQLDNADATGRQIITHEFTHALIKNLSVKLGRDALGNLSESGESSFGTIRDYMAQELGGQDKLVQAVNAYAEVYKAAGAISADANGNISKADLQMVFEEMICDFVAGMNAFAEVGHVSTAVRSAPVMAAAKKSLEQMTNGTRGSPSAGAYLPRTQSEQRNRYDGSSEMYAIDPNGRKYSLGSLKSDIFDNKFQNDLISKLGWTQNQVKALVASLNDLMEYIKPNRDILDLNETYTKENRPYSPYKPNSDPLYKISLDYSTLCRKRLMTQYIIEKLQLREHRPMSGEEQIAIRDMLKEYRQIESGLQVACAMCYVEAARLKSPDQMNRYFDDPEPVLKNYFAQKNKAYKRKVENLQKKWKTEHGYEATATKKEMTPADVAAFNEYSSKVRHDYNPATDQADAKRRKEELAAIERAKNLSPDNYLSAENLANLKEQDPLVYDAYTSNIRAATRSKGLETDVPYYYGDSRRKGGPSDKFIKNVNAENGMRFSSWSDFQFTHLLDQMMAVIDLSVRKAAMHGYTKFPEQVRIFGKTGAMFNMSGVPDATGLNSDGSLRFSPTESIDIEEARRLRDQFPETAGVQCIGISDEHVKALLRSEFIDYVIPYHVSGLNAVLRQMVKIASWQDYTGSQEESVIDSKAKWEDSDRKCPKDKWHKGPVFSEFFDPAWYTDPAYKGKGVEAMREAARRYVQMCADRGMRPKFTQFLGEENYWKLLIDRKMVNQNTGDLIQQKPVTPDFDFDVIKKEIAYYVEKTRAEQGIEDRAFDYVAEHWDEMPGRIAALKQEGAVEKNIAKAEERKRRVMEHQANVLGNEMYAAAPKNVAAYKYSRSLDSAGNQLTEQQAEYFKDSKVRDENGNLLAMYHGTDADFNIFDFQRGGEHGKAEGFGIYLADDRSISEHYGGRVIESYANITRPARSDSKTIKSSELTKLIKATCLDEAKKMAEEYGGKIADALRDTWVSNYVYTYDKSMDAVYREVANNILRLNDNDMDIVQEVMAGMAIRTYDAAMAFYNDILTPTTGIDGFITNWSEQGSDNKHLIALAFNSNQVKNTDNQNPTSNPDIRYSLDLVPPVEPSSEAWKRTKTTEEAMRIYPNLWNVAAEESEKRNPTQVSSTQSTYRRIYDILKKEGFSGRILDASSGLGIGTRVGREEYGFDVDDIEPYPGDEYEPKYRDYSKLNKKYDAIISSAVLNVLPQDQRDALVVKMGKLLNPGGRIFVTTRGKEVEDSLKKSGKNIRLDNMEWIETSRGSYQKGFTDDELKAYLEDALGNGFTVEKSNASNGGRFNNNTSIVVTKNAEAIRFSRDLDTQYMAAAESGDTETAQRLVDEAAKAAGYTVKAYHGTHNFGRTKFNADWPTYLTSKPGTARAFSGGVGPRSLSSKNNVDSMTTDELISAAESSTYMKNIKRATKEQIDDEYRRYNDYGKSKIDSARAKGEPIFRWSDDNYNDGIVTLSEIKADLNEVFNNVRKGGTYTFYVNPGDALTVYGDGAYYTSIPVDGMLAETLGKRTASTDEILKVAADLGFDSVIYKDIAEGGDYGRAGRSDVYAVVRPDINLKSADPITYDDDGNIIPLSERFNSENDDIRYSRDLDSAGNQLTKAQAEYFKDSKVRDDNGNLMVMYHGSVEDFDTFDKNKIRSSDYDTVFNGFWFSSDESTSPAFRDAKYTKKVYLNITNPAPRNVWRKVNKDVINDGKIRSGARSYDDEVRYRLQDMGYDGVHYDGPYTFDEQNVKEYNKTGSTTFTSAGGRQYDLRKSEYDDARLYPHGSYNEIAPYESAEDFLEQNRNEYRTSDIWVAFEPEQIKRVDNQNPTSNPDTRFSRDLSSGELYEANRQLQKDLTELRSKLKTRTEQRDYWRRQTQKTDDVRLKQDVIKNIAKEVIKTNNSKADQKAVAEKLNELGNILLQTDNENWYDDARMKCYEIAHMVNESAEVLDQRGGEHFYKDFRDALKQAPIYVAPSVREEVAPDGWNDFRKAQFGTVNMTADQNKGKSVDTVYHDLQATFGEWLLPEYVTSEADQLNKILEVVETYRPIYENMNSYEMAEANEWVANEILTRTMELMEIGELRQEDSTRADIARERLNAEKQKSAEALKQVRQQRDRKVADLKAHYQQEAEDRRNRKVDSENRSRLLKIARRLNNKKLDRVTRGLLDQYIGELDLVSKGILDRTIKDIEHLRDWYDAYKDKMGEDFVPDISIENRIKRLSQKHINDLTQEEVADLTTVLLNIETMLRTKDKLLESQIKSDVYAAGMQTIDDIANSNGKTGFLAEYIGAETASPERYIHRITGYRENSPLYQAAKELSDGQRKMLDYQRRAEALFKKWTTDKKFIRRIAGKHAEAITARGYVDGTEKELNITPAMAMSLYLHAKNDDNMRHISQGGVMIPDMELYLKGKLQDAYAKGERVVFTRSMIAEITAKLDEKEKSFADAVGRYYNTMSRDEINDVSEILKGFAIAGVENYFPIDTNGNFLAKTFDTIKRDGSIEGMGFLKERIDNASTPIMLYDLNTILNRSISQHSKYVGLAIPVRNFEKLYNVTTFTDNGVDFKANPLDPGWRYDTSIATTLEKNWGKAATSYVAKMMADIENGTGLKDDKWGDLLARARSKYAGAVLTTNASVAMKQAASYPTAAAVVGYKALGKALADFRKYGEKTVDMDKLAEYTPLYWYRSKGFVDPELGDIGKEGRQIPKALNWIQGIDMLTTRKLAKAAMYYVLDNNKDLVKGTDAWWKEVARVYNRIIEETQPNYTMMQRPQILRSDNALTRALQMFKTQPFQNFNILYDAFGNLAAKSREYKANATEENLQALKSARTNVARAVSSQAVSAIVFALMQWAWDAFRGKVKKYRDDDDEKDLLSWLKGIGLNVASSVGGMIPFGSYALELGEAMTDAILKGFNADPIFDQTFYGMSENASESLNDMGNALLNIVSKTSKTLEAGELTESSVRSLADSVEDIAQFAGVPVKNVVNFMQAIARNVILVSEKDDFMAQYKALRITTDPAKYKSDYYSLLEKAYHHSDTSYEKLYNALIADKDLITGGESFATESKDAKANVDASVKKWGYALLEDAWHNRPDEYPALREKMINLPGDPFATESKTAAENIDAKEKSWKKEQSNQSKEKETLYSTVYDEMVNTDLWWQATENQRGKALDTLLNLALETGVEGTGGSSGAKAKEIIDGGKQVGLDATEYMLFQIALSMADPDGGSHTNAQYEQAINTIPSLSEEEKAYLWSATHKSDKNNPWK